MGSVDEAVMSLLTNRGIVTQGLDHVLMRLSQSADVHTQVPSTMTLCKYSAIARDEVAAGEGAFRSAITEP